MALPAITVASLEVLQAMAALGEPRAIDLAAVDSVRRAPQYLVIIDAMEAEGWVCDRLPHLRKFARFSTILAALANDVFIRLAHDPTDRQALRDLRSRGQAILRLRKGAAGQPLLVHLAGQFSNSLARAARHALSSDTPYELSLVRINELLACVNTCLDTSIHFPELVLLPDDEAALPTITVGNLEELQAMAALGEPRAIDLAAVDSVRRAPQYLVAIGEKETEGWVCDRLPYLRKFARLSDLLTTLADDVFIRLALDPTDRQALRDLRSRGQAILRLRKGAADQPFLVHIAGLFSNSLARAARQALRRNTEYQLSHERIADFVASINDCLATRIDFPESAPVPAAEGGQAQDAVLMEESSTDEEEVKGDMK